MGEGGGGLGLIIARRARAPLRRQHPRRRRRRRPALARRRSTRPCRRPRPAPRPATRARGGRTKDDAFEFAKFVSSDAQDMWTQVFQQSGKQYTRAPVVIFTSGTMSGCGPASSATGPFYCPADHKVYLDLSFFQELSRRFGAPGDFAAAYVIAHEIGHHIQSELGIEEQIRRKQQDDPGERERLLGAARAPGRLLRRRLGAVDVRPRACSIRATSRRGSRRRPRSATTGSARGAASSGRTARPRCARSGSGRGSTPASRERLRHERRRRSSRRAGSGRARPGPHAPDRQCGSADTGSSAAASAPARSAAIPSEDTLSRGVSDDGACRGAGRGARRGDHEDPPLDRREAGRRDVGPQRPGLQPGDSASRRARSTSRRSRRSTPPCGTPPRRGQSWRTVSLAKRAELFFRIRELFHAHREDLAKLLTAEHGKVLSDAMGEVARGLEVIEFACGIPTLIKGEFSEQASTGIDVYSIRQPLGVVAGHHAVQLPRDGAHVDVGARDRLRQLLRPQALGEGPVRLAPDGRAAQGGRPARRRLQRRPRRQGRGRRAARAPGRRRGLVRRLDADRAVHLRDRDEARQARAGARRARRTT